MKKELFNEKTGMLNWDHVLKDEDRETIVAVHKRHRNGAVDGRIITDEYGRKVYICLSCKKSMGGRPEDDCINKLHWDRYAKGHNGKIPKKLNRKGDKNDPVV